MRLLYTIYLFMLGSVQCTAKFCYVINHPVLVTILLNQHFLTSVP
jgi:hypothetical protein